MTYSYHGIIPMAHRADGQRNKGVMRELRDRKREEADERAARVDPKNTAAYRREQARLAVQGDDGK
jgi:hypothetical protein